MLEAPALLLIALLTVAVYTSFRHATLPFALTLGGSFAGQVCAAVFPQVWGEDSSMAALAHSVPGFFSGLFAAWLLVELGKAIFGKVTHHFLPIEHWSVEQLDDCSPPVIFIGEATYQWGDLFARTSDCIRIDCATLNMSRSSFKNVIADLKMETLTIREPGNHQTLRLEEVTLLNGTASKVVIPREIMGFGVVFLSGMIGSFLGSLPALGILAGSLLLMLFVASLYSLSTRTRWTAKTEIAPYSLLTCLVFVVLKHFKLL